MLVANELLAENYGVGRRFVGIVARRGDGDVAFHRRGLITGWNRRLPLELLNEQWNLEMRVETR